MKPDRDLSMGDAVIAMLIAVGLVWLLALFFQPRHGWCEWQYQHLRDGIPYGGWIYPHDEHGQPCPSDMVIKCARNPTLRGCG